MSVFVSYSSSDRGFVEQLVRDLQDNGISTWYDDGEMLPGDSLTERIGDAILKNDHFVVILSPNSAKSEWVTREIGVALNKEFSQRNVTVVPVLYRDCDIPPFLRDKVYADFRSDYRAGLESLIGAVSSGDFPGGEIRSNLPAAAKSRVHWDNVVGSNLTTANIIRSNVLGENDILKDTTEDR